MFNRKMVQERNRVFSLGPGNVASAYSFKEDLTLDAEVTLLLKGANVSSLIYLFEGELTTVQCLQRLGGGSVGEVAAKAAVNGVSWVELNLPANPGKFTLYDDGNGTAALSIVNARFQCFEYVPLHLHVPPHFREERLPRRSPEVSNVPPMTHTAERVVISARGGYDQ